MEALSDIRANQDIFSPGANNLTQDAYILNTLYVFNTRRSSFYSVDDHIAHRCYSLQSLDGRKQVFKLTVIGLRTKLVKELEESE